MLFKKWSKQTSNERDCREYINLHTPCLIDEHALITKQSARVSLIRLNGNMNLCISEKSDEFLHMCKALVSLSKTLLTQPGVTSAWMYEHDPNNAEVEIRETLRPGMNAANKLGVDLSLVNDTLIQENAELCLSQESVLAIWTTPSLPQEYVKGKVVDIETENSTLRDMHEKLFSGSANPFLSDTKNIQAHKKNVKKAVETLRNAGMICYPLKNKVAANWMHQKINANQSKYSSLQFPDDERVGTPLPGTWLLNAETGALDLSRVTAQPLDAQMVRRRFNEVEDADGIIHQNGRYYATCTVDLAPKQAVPFRYLMNSLKDTPLRMTFMMKAEPKTLSNAIRNRMNDYLGGLSDGNREIYRQLQVMKYYQKEHGQVPINLQILITTWGDSEQEAKSNAERINQNIVDWGGARIELDSLSPFQTFFSCIPGVNTVSHSDSVLIIPEKLAVMLPHQLESSLNEYGPIIFRHESGKICAHSPQNRFQLSRYTILVAKARQGKSLLMNAQTVAMLASEGAESLPLICSMDIGPSSEGGLQLIRLLLKERFGPEVAKKMVVSLKWDPSDKEWIINPLDIRLGRDIPTEQELKFILNFYTSVCANPETGQPEEGVKDILVDLIDLLFMHFSKPQYQRQFTQSKGRRLVERLRKHSIPTTLQREEDGEQISRSYFSLRDDLFLKGDIEGASIAQRLAVPDLNDMIDFLTTNAEIKSKTEKIYPGLIDKVAHKLRSHRSMKKHLCGATTLDLSSANIVSFDLKPIMTDNSDNHSRLMLFTEYLLAMNLGLDKFMIQKTILDGMSPIYLKYWQEQITRYSHVSKCLNLDEWHALTIKTTTNEGKSVSMPIAGAAYIEYLIKEGPKWNVDIVQASHSSSDFTSYMKSSASNIFIYSGMSGLELDDLAHDFHLTDSQKNQVEQLHSPDTERGSQMLWMYKVSLPGMNSVMGSAKVEYLCKGQLLWGLNTSAKDLPHKIRLEEECAGKPWLEALCIAYPTGTMEEYRQGLIEQLRESNIESERASIGVEEQLYQKVLVEIKRLEFGDGLIRDAQVIKDKLLSQA